MVATIIYLFWLHSRVEESDYEEFEEDIAENTQPQGNGRRGRGAFFYILCSALVLIWIGAILHLFLLYILPGLLLYESGMLLIAVSLIVLVKGEEKSLVRVIAMAVSIVVFIWALIIALGIFSWFTGIHVLATIFITSPSLST